VKKRKELARNEFSEQLKAYRRTAGVSQGNLAKYLGKQQPYIVSIEKGDHGIGIDIMNEISTCFGVKYYEMANPRFAIPSKKQLHKSIREYVKSTGIDTSYLDRVTPNYARNMDKYLVTELLIKPKTAMEICADYIDMFDETILPSKVTDILTRPPRNKKVIVIKPDQGRGNRYQLAF